MWSIAGRVGGAQMVQLRPVLRFSVPNQCLHDTVSSWFSSAKFVPFVSPVSRFRSVE